MTGLLQRYLLSLFSRWFTPVIVALYCGSLLSACTSSNIIITPKREDFPAELVYRPVEVNTDIARAHVAMVDQAMLAALRNRGYLTLRQPEREKEAASRPEGRLLLETFRRSSLVAGHVNTISGRFQVTDVDREIIAEVKHTETERGGVVFNSGQVLTGIRSEADNLRGRNLERWVRRFSEALVRLLPKPEVRRFESIQSAPEIRTVSVPVHKADRSVCAEGTAGIRASLVLGNDTFPMRAVAEGTYCTVLPTYIAKDALSEGSVVFDSPYGLRASQALPLRNVGAPCPIEGVVGQRFGDSITLEVRCQSGSSDEGLSCADIAPCGDLLFRLYAVAEPIGFTLLDEFGADGGLAKLSGDYSGAAEHLQLFRVSRASGFQNPFALTLQQTKGGSEDEI